MGQTCEMKMARATGDDFERVMRFFQMLEEVVEYGTYTPPDDENEEVSEDVDDARLSELIHEAWNTTGPGVGSAWRRVVFGGQLAIDQLTDPNCRHLEIRPDIAKAMEALGVEL